MFDMIFWVVVSGVCYFAYKLDQSLNASSSSHQVKISTPKDKGRWFLLSMPRH